MKKLLALLCLLPLPLIAAQVTVTYTLPTQQVDANNVLSPIPAAGPEALASVTIQHMTCAAVTDAWPASPTTIVNPVPATSRVITGLAGGQRYCFRAAAVNNSGGTSNWSNVATAIAPASVPLPPTNVTVAVIVGSTFSPVFGVLADNSRSATVYGAVDAGKACGAVPLFTYRGRTWREVNKADVLKWSGVTLPARVAGPCS